MYAIKRIFMLVIVLIISQQMISAQDWTQWRGANRDGVAASFKNPKTYPNELKKEWTVDVGEGASSPVVSGNRIYLLSRLKEQETVSCLDLSSGKVLWRDAYSADYVIGEAAETLGKSPRATPLVYNGKLYTVGVSGSFSAYDAKTGKLLWRKNVADTGSQKAYPYYGYSISPLMTDGLLIAPIGGGKQSGLAAFNPDTGEVKWKWIGEYKDEGGGIGYSSPMLVQREGVRHLVMLTDTGLVGLAPSNGTLLWKFPFSLEWGNSVMPIIHNEHFIVSDKTSGTVAVRLFKKGNEWATEQAWQNKDFFFYMSAPVIKNNLMYGLSSKNKGQYFCLDLSNGKEVWKSQGRDGEYASLMLAGEDLLIQNLEGELIVTKSNAKTFEPIRRYKLANSSTWAHPVLLREQILIKDMSNLSLWDLK